MAPVAREYFTVDLRGLRAALTASAARDGVTESHVLRSALAVALGSDGSVPVIRCVEPCQRAPATRLESNDGFRRWRSLGFGSLIDPELPSGGRTCSLQSSHWQAHLLDSSRPGEHSAN